MCLWKIGMNILTNRLSHFSMSGKWPISSLGPATVRPPKRRRFAWLGDGQWPRTEMAGAENGDDFPNPNDHFNEVAVRSL